MSNGRQVAVKDVDRSKERLVPVAFLLMEREDLLNGVTAVLLAQ